MIKARYVIIDLFTSYIVALIAGMKYKLHSIKHMSSIQTVYFVLIWIGIFALFMVCSSYKKKNLRFTAFFMPLSAVFSIFITLGYWMEKILKDWSIFFDNSRYMLSTGLKFLAYTVIIYCVFKSFYIFYVNRDKIFEKENSKFFGADFWKNPRKVFFITFIILMIPCLVFLFFFYPGIMTGDTQSSIAQFYGNFTHASKVSGAVSSSQYLTDHHMALFTLVFGLFVKFGEMLGSQTFGYFLLCLGVASLNSFAKAYTVRFLSEFNFSSKASFGLICMYFFYTPFLLWSVCAVKDTIFSPLLLFYVTVIITAFKRENGFKTPKFWIPFGILSLLIPFAKHQGIYIVAVCCIVLLIVNRKYWYVFATTLVSVVLIVNVLVMGFLYPALGILPVGKQESYGVFFQQTARYVHDYPDEVTKEEKEAIDNVLVYDRISENYRYKKQDPIKFLYRNNKFIVEKKGSNEKYHYVTNEMMKEYMKVWGQMFFKHPTAYVKATAYCIYSFFYPKSSVVASINVSEKWDKHAENVDIIPSKHFRPIREKVYTMIATLRNNSFTRMFFSVFGITWMFLIVTVALMYKKKWRELCAFLPMVVSFLLLFISPCALYRYVMPMAYAVPLMIVLLFSCGKKKGVSC